MLDFGFDKIALIGAVALIVIGPQRLPKVARTVGHLMGKAQRYVAEVKAEVNRSIELEELKKAKNQFEDAARGFETSVNKELHEAGGDFEKAWNDGVDSTTGLGTDGSPFLNPSIAPPSYRHPKKNWRLKRGVTPSWYMHQVGVRTHAQSGAARVARFRPEPR